MWWRPRHQQRGRDLGDAFHTAALFGRQIGPEAVPANRQEQRRAACRCRVCCARPAGSGRSDRVLRRNPPPPPLNAALPCRRRARGGRHRRAESRSHRPGPAAAPDVPPRALRGNRVLCGARPQRHQVPGRALDAAAVMFRRPDAGALAPGHRGRGRHRLNTTHFAANVPSARPRWAQRDPRSSVGSLHRGEICVEQNEDPRSRRLAFSSAPGNAVVARSRRGRLSPAQSAVIGMRFTKRCASGRLATVTVRTPFLNAAVTLSGSTSGPSCIERPKRPCQRSL